MYGSTPLSCVADKCYKYSPLVTVSKCYEMHSVDKKKWPLPFQVICFPRGYNEGIMGAYLAMNFLPQLKVLSHFSGGKNYKVAKNFHQAEVRSLCQKHLFLLKIYNDWERKVFL